MSTTRSPYNIEPAPSNREIARLTTKVLADKTATDADANTLLPVPIRYTENGHVDTMNLGWFRQYDSPEAVAAAIRSTEVKWPKDGSRTMNRTGWTTYSLDETVAAWARERRHLGKTTKPMPELEQLAVTIRQRASAATRPVLSPVGVVPAISPALAGNPASMLRKPRVNRALLGHGKVMFIDIGANAGATSADLQRTATAYAQAALAMRAGGVNVGVAIGSLSLAMNAGQPITYPFGFAVNVFGPTTPFDPKMTATLCRTETQRRIRFALQERSAIPYNWQYGRSPDNTEQSREMFAALIPKSFVRVKASPTHDDHAACELVKATLATEFSLAID